MRKVRFLHRNLKILVTRISGLFNIYSEEKKAWDKKFTKGSFVIDKSMYDDILEEIAKMQNVYLYEVTIDTISRNSKKIRAKKHIPCLDTDGYIPDLTHFGLPFRKLSYMIFAIYDGEVGGRGTYADIPKIDKPPIVYKDKIYLYLYENDMAVEIDDDATVRSIHAAVK